MHHNDLMCPTKSCYGSVREQRRACEPSRRPGQWAALEAQDREQGVGGEMEGDKGRSSRTEWWGEAGVPDT